MILTIAWRYIRGKKSTQAIQVISWVSILAMAIGAAALIIVLSVFNGFEGFVKDLYSNFYPSIRITPVHGKSLPVDTTFLNALQKIKGVQAISGSLEERVLFTNNETQVIATLKGIDTNYNKVTSIKEHVRYGNMDFSNTTGVVPAVLGIGVSNKLGASEESRFPVTCYAFRNGKGSLLDMATSYQSMLMQVTGVYVLQEEIDSRYVLAPLDAVQELSGKPGQFSSIELKLNGDADDQDAKAAILNIPGAVRFTVETRYEQNKTFYFILKTERWAVYAILTLMLLIASFNIVGCLSMIVMEKDKDIAILKTMGMTGRQVQGIFLNTGMLLSVIGAGIGCLLAGILCFLQQQFGFVKLGGSGSFLLEAYPVAMRLSDFLLVFATVILIAGLASLYPSARAALRSIELRVR